MKTLRIALLIDFLLTFIFGIVSFFNPKNTFGTIIEIPQHNEGLFLSVLAGLSVFYIIIGLACLAGTRLNHPYLSWISGIMLIRHFWIGIVGILDVNQPWIIGNPYYDIVIHFIFVILYAIGISISFRPKVS